MKRTVLPLTLAGCCAHGGSERKASDLTTVENPKQHMKTAHKFILIQKQVLKIKRNHFMIVICLLNGMKLFLFFYGM